MGAIRGFAVLKFSTSLIKFGLFEMMKIIKIEIRIIGIVSFIENRGLNLTLSLFVGVLDGLEDPFSWRRIK
jgi:hypothetical protein